MARLSKVAQSLSAVGLEPVTATSVPSAVIVPYCFSSYLAFLTYVRGDWTQIMLALRMRLPLMRDCLGSGLIG